MKNECSIVRDLLPLYAEGMLSEDSAAFVKEHLDTCEECRALSAGEEPFAPTDADTEQRTGEAGVLRTLKKKLRKQTWCAIFITAAVVLRRRLKPTRRSACRGHLFRVIFRALRLLFVTASGVGAAGARAARISASESMSFSSNRFVKVSTTASVL